MTNSITVSLPTPNSSNLTPSSSRTVLSRLHLKTEKARRTLHEFVWQAWPRLGPAPPFGEGMHVRAVCEHLQAVTEGRLRHLIIHLPPGQAKSLLTAVFWPAWVWIDHPEARWLFSSYREPLATRDSVKCRRLIESDWYQERWGGRYQLSGDQNQKNRFENTRTGYRVVVPMSAGTGERGDYVVVDDPHSVDQAASDTERHAAVEWWNGSMATRLNDLSSGHKVVIMQRLHEADLTGDLLAKGGYDLLCLPAEFEPGRRCATSIDWSDPRQESGELLWPEKVSRADLDGLKTTLGSYRYAAQYQQRPAPAEGGVFKRCWGRYWRPAPRALAPVQGRLADGLLLDQRRERMDMPRTVEAIRGMSEQWSRAAAKLVEDRANGPAVIATLKHEIAGLIAVNPEGGKIARAAAVSPQIESGNVYLPHPAIAPWVEDLIEECAAFPCAAHDDQVDALTQALNRLHGVSRRIYTVQESEIAVDPIPIPAHWPCVFGMDVRVTETAALWGACDPQTDTLYVYSEHCQSGAEAAIHALGIGSRGKWIPGLLDPTANGRSQSDGFNLMRIYKELGLDLDVAMDSEQSGVCEVLQRMRSGRLKVFRKNSRNWLGRQTWRSLSHPDDFQIDLRHHPLR